jgi:Domain of unknown function (DUF3854)
MNLGESYLAARGITPETIQAHNIEIDAPPSEERILERLRKDILLDGVPLSKFAEAIIWFAIQGLAGDVVSYIARPLRSGETAPPSGMPKFLTPFGGTAPPFISPSTLAIRKDISIPLLIPEGPVKALSLGQAGGCAAGLSGVWAGGWKTEADKYILRPELASFQLAGRKVPLAFDADFRAKADVRHAMIRQAFLLSIKWRRCLSIDQLGGGCRQRDRRLPCSEGRLRHHTAAGRSKRADGKGGTLLRDHHAQRSTLC